MFSARTELVGAVEPESEEEDVASESVLWDTRLSSTPKKLSSTPDWGSCLLPHPAIVAVMTITRRIAVIARRRFFMVLILS